MILPKVQAIVEKKGNISNDGDISITGSYSNNKNYLRDGIYNHRDNEYVSLDDIEMSGVQDIIYTFEESKTINKIDIYFYPNNTNIEPLEERKKIIKIIKDDEDVELDENNLWNEKIGLSNPKIVDSYYLIDEEGSIDVISLYFEDGLTLGELKIRFMNSYGTYTGNDQRILEIKLSKTIDISEDIYNIKFLAQRDINKIIEKNEINMTLNNVLGDYNFFNNYIEFKDKVYIGSSDWVLSDEITPIGIYYIKDIINNVENRTANFICCNQYMILNDIYISQDFPILNNKKIEYLIERLLLEFNEFHSSMYTNEQSNIEINTYIAEYDSIAKNITKLLEAGGDNEIIILETGILKYKNTNDAFVRKRKINFLEDIDKENVAPSGWITADGFIFRQWEQKFDDFLNYYSYSGDEIYQISTNGFYDSGKLNLTKDYYMRTRLYYVNVSSNEITLDLETISENMSVSEYFVLTLPFPNSENFYKKISFKIELVQKSPSLRWKLYGYINDVLTRAEGASNDYVYIYGEISQIKLESIFQSGKTYLRITITTDTDSYSYQWIFYIYPNVLITNFELKTNCPSASPSQPCVKVSRIYNPNRFIGGVLSKTIVLEEGIENFELFSLIITEITDYEIYTNTSNNGIDWEGWKLVEDGRIKSAPNRYIKFLIRLFDVKTYYKLVECKYCEIVYALKEQNIISDKTITLLPKNLNYNFTDEQEKQKTFFNVLFIPIYSFTLASEEVVRNEELYTLNSNRERIFNFVFEANDKNQVFYLTPQGESELTFNVGESTQNNIKVNLVAYTFGCEIKITNLRETDLNIEKMRVVTNVYSETSKKNFTFLNNDSIEKYGKVSKKIDNKNIQTISQSEIIARNVLRFRKEPAKLLSDMFGFEFQKKVTFEKLVLIKDEVNNIILRVLPQSIEHLLDVTNMQYETSIDGMIVYYEDYFTARYWGRRGYWGGLGDGRGQYWGGIG